jgi:ribonuclease J
MLFPTAEQPGVDYCIPDTSYLRERQHKLRAVLITHAHEDHYGAVPFLLPELDVPIYGTDLTMSLLAGKLAEFPELEPDLRRLRDGQAVEFGELRVTPLAVTHSVPDAIGMAIETPAGIIVHTGDFKLDPDPVDGRHTDVAALRALGDRGVTLLLSDSTNSERPGHTWGEREVGQALAEVIARAPLRVLVTTFASNVHRLQAVITASEAVGRKVVLAGRSVMETAQIAIDRGHLRIKPHTLVPIEAFDGVARSRLTVIASGSQGEPHSTLARIAAGSHGAVKLEPGDWAVMSSRRIPGNERAVSTVINNFYRLGVEVIDDRVAKVHTSGHAYNDEQIRMLELVRPRFFVPVHGEYRHMVRHGRLANEHGVPPDRVIVVEDGQPIDLWTSADGVVARRAEAVTAGLVFVDGKRVGEVGEVVLRDRRHLSEMGMVVCVAIFREGGGIVAGPDIHTRGLFVDEENREVIERAEGEVLDALKKQPGIDVATRKEEIRAALKRFFRKELDRRPLIVPVVMTL